jgi:hypothetical protein
MKSTNNKRNEIFGNMDNLEYVRFMEKKGYEMERLHIDETSEIVTVCDLEKDHYGKVIDIRCPSRYKIFILGRQQLPKNASPDIIHTLAIRLADSNGNEIPPDSRIRITKDKPDLSTAVCAYALYKDVSKTEYSKILPNSTKPTSKLYKFNNIVQLNGEDHLSIYANQPDLDISRSNTRLDLDIDLWEER